MGKRLKNDLINKNASVKHFEKTLIKILLKTALKITHNYLLSWQQYKICDFF